MFLCLLLYFIVGLAIMAWITRQQWKKAHLADCSPGVAAGVALASFLWPITLLLLAGVYFAQLLEKGR